MRLFYRFIIDHHEDAGGGDTISKDDIRLKNSVLTRLYMWPEVFSDATNLHKAAIRRRDMEEKLTTPPFQSFIQSGQALEIIQMYETMAVDPQDSADVKTFSAMRDYLLLRVMMASGQHCGAASYTTKTLRHKMSSGGPANCCGMNSLKVLWTHTRDMFPNQNSVAPAAVSIPKMPLFFYFNSRESTKQVECKPSPCTCARALSAYSGKRVIPRCLPHSWPNKWGTHCQWHNSITTQKPVSINWKCRIKT